MKTAKDIISKYAVLLFFFLTILITWGGIFSVIGLGGILGKEPIPDESMPILYLATLLGPSLAGILMTAVADGKQGFRSLAVRMFKRKVGMHWYIAVLVSAPILITIILLMLSSNSPNFLPALAAAENKTSLLLTGAVMGLAVGFFEELGWTGFAIPKLRLHFSPLATGIITGLVWGAWHFPLFAASDSASGGIPPVIYISVMLFSFLPAYRVLMVWVYEQTNSLLIAILMHAPLSASQLVLIPPALAGKQLATYNLVFTGILWGITAVIAIFSSDELVRLHNPN